MSLTDLFAIEPPDQQSTHFRRGPLGFNKFSVACPVFIGFWVKVLHHLTLRAADVPKVMQHRLMLAYSQEASRARGPGWGSGDGTNLYKIEQNSYRVAPA
jgi:hypothetical protein